MTKKEIINEIKCILSELNNGENAVSYLTQNDVKWLNENIKTLEQEPILDKINKMKSEIADSLEFWDYSPNNNPLARDMLETITNFWGDMKERGM